MNLKNNLVLILLIILSSLLILYKFTFIPKYLAFDEVEFTKLALSLEGKPYAAYSSLATGHSTLYFYIILLSLKIFGVNVFALRLPAAIFGILSVVIFYLIKRIIFQQYNNITIKQYFPFILTFILLSSHWFLNFSRFAFEPTFLLFLELMSIYFLFQCFKTLKWQYLVFSGLFSGLAFNSYTPGRIFFLLPLFFLTLKTLRTLKLYKLVYFIIPFFITITPLTSYLMTHKEARINQQFFLRNSEMTINEKLSGLWQNISSTSLMFFTKGDVNGRHNYPGKPALNTILGILFLIGLITTMKQWNNETNRFFLLYFLLSIFPALMTYPWENPNMLRTFTVIPSVVYFIGVGITVILGTNEVRTPESLLDSGHARSSLARMTIVLAFILLSSLYEVRTYFKYQAKVFEDSFEIKYPLEKAIKMKNPYEKIK